MTKKACAVIAAAGSGRRMGGVSKPNIQLLGKTLFEYVLGAFDRSSVSEIIVVCSEDNELSLKGLAKDCKTPLKFVRGGATRAESVFIGVSSASPDTEIICAHDCARPFLTAETVDEIISVAEKFGAACVCSPVTDTIKYKNPENGEISTPERANLFAVQTPQCFLKSLYFSAVEKAENSIDRFTDETSLLENSGVRVEYIPKNEINMKLTATDDVPIAEILMKRKVNLK